MNDRGTKAEMIWTLVRDGYCTCSNEDMNQILAAIFSHFETTKSFSMSISKSIYFKNHNQLLILNLYWIKTFIELIFHVYSLHLSLNEATQTTEVDRYLCLQGTIENRFKARAWNL